MPGPSGRTRGARMTLLSAGASVGLPAGPAWAQPGGVTVRAGGEESTVVADQLQEVGGATDLLIAISNVEITRGQTRLLADRVELNRDTGQAVVQGKVDSCKTTASFVNFIRDVGPDGVRADFHPRLLMPLAVAGLFTVTPFAGGRLTYYDERVVGQRVTRWRPSPWRSSVYDPRVRRQVEWAWRRRAASPASTPATAAGWRPTST